DDLIRQLFQIFRRFLEGVRRAVDIYEVMGGAYSGDNYRNVLYANPGNSNHWIKLKLEGVRSNRAAIGARLRVEVETAQGVRSIHKTVNTGGIFRGESVATRNRPGT